MNNNQYLIRKLDFLEALRGLASLYVVIHHARWFLWEGYSEGYLKHPENYNAAEKLLVYFFSAFIYGHEMVIFFFILSGFVIHLRYSQRLKADEMHFDHRNYYTRRIKRIYPPLLFAIAFTFVVDSTGKHFEFPIYGPNSPFRIVKDNFTISNLIGNCLFVMNTYVETWGSDFALWSLKYEWWFYCLFPLFFELHKKSIIGTLALIIILFILSYFGNYWPVKLLQEVFSYMLIWWLGVLLADTYTRRIHISFKYLIPLILFIPTAILYKQGNQVTNDLLWGLGFVGILSIFFYLNDIGKLGFSPKISVLGSFSYSLYIIHTPILVYMSGYVLKHNARLPSTFGWMFIGVICSVIFAYLIHFFVEKPFLSRTGTK